MRKLLLTALLLISAWVQAGEDNVFRHSTPRPMNEVYDWLYKELEQQNFYVVFEANIGKNLSGFAEKWGEDYNTSRLDGIRSMVFCNAWYANLVSNADPAMLAICPLHITLIEKEGVTTALFVRPSRVAADSPAREVLLKVEDKITGIIRQAMPSP